MYIDRILFPIETLGPGNRLVIWTKGCNKHCMNCANPELWSTEGAKNINVNEIIQIIKNIHKDTPVEGITISGGDPFEQIDEIIELTSQLKLITDDILVYTGYYFKDIQNQWNQEIVDNIRRNISVLIDGPYIDSLNRKECVLRGSENQKIIYFNERFQEKYTKYLSEGRKIQNVYMVLFSILHAPDLFLFKQIKRRY